MTKKLHQEFSRADNRILGALFELDEFFQSPQAHKPGFILELFRRHPGIQTEKTIEGKRTAPRMILILKWVSLWVNPLKISAGMRLTTILTIVHRCYENLLNLWTMLINSNTRKKCISLPALIGVSNHVQFVLSFFNLKTWRVCRSMSAKPAGRCCPGQTTSQFLLQKRLETQQTLNFVYVFVFM